MSTTPPPPTDTPTPAAATGAPPLLRRIASFTRRRSRDGSHNLSHALPTLERRLTEKTDLIDGLKKIVPLDVEAPGIIALGFQGAGKSTILEAITGVPIPRAHAGSPMAEPGCGARKVLRMRINSDPTVTK